VKSSLPLSDLSYTPRDPRDERQRQNSPELLDAWARQLAAMIGHVPSVVDERPTPTLTAAGTPRTAPSAASTAARAAQASNDPQNSDATGDNRLTLTVNTEALGEISVIIDRTDGGVRVVLGVNASAAESALSPEKAALMKALTTVGLNVHSVNVVRQVGLGTVLAEGTLGEFGSPDAKDKAGVNRDDAKVNKKLKRINFTG
jgi:hypothetical protein